MKKKHIKNGFLKKSNFFTVYTIPRCLKITEKGSFIASEASYV